MYLYITQTENNVNIIILGEKNKTKKFLNVNILLDLSQSISGWLLSFPCQQLHIACTFPTRKELPNMNPEINKPFFFLIGKRDEINKLIVISVEEWSTKFF